jgi:hypothetical protein
MIFRKSVLLTAGFFSVFFLIGALRLMRWNLAHHGAFSLEYGNCPFTVVDAVVIAVFAIPILPGSFFLIKLFRGRFILAAAAMSLLAVIAAYADRAQFSDSPSCW